MKFTTPLGGGAFAFLFGCAIFGGVEVAQAQSICTCPARFQDVGNGLCCPNGSSLSDGFCSPEGGTPIPATCRGATPQIGQIAASQQQLSFSTVAGVLRTRRDQLQGPLGSQSAPPSPLAYSTFNLDESYRLLGYAPGADRNPVYGADKNPLRKAPPAPAVAAGPTWAAWVEGIGDWERRKALDANDTGRTQETYGVH